MTTTASRVRSQPGSDRHPGRTSSATKPAADKINAGKNLQAVGFTARSQAGPGAFMTEQQIAEVHATEATDLLTGVPGIRVDYSTGYPALVDAYATDGGCVSYVVDGIAKPLPEPTDFNDLVGPGDIAAMEVYAAEQTPHVFRSSAGRTCEAVVVWTNHKIDS
jgi:hypothetical protein